MNIVIMDAGTVTAGDLSLERFAKYGNVTTYEFCDYDDVAGRVADADIVLCNKAPMDFCTLKDAARVKYIGLFATGYNNVDLEYCDRRGITVSNAGEYSTTAVVQHVFALILHRYNKVAEYDRFVKEGQWEKSRMFSPFMPMHEISGKTIGIIGFGSIGTGVAKVANAFGMRVLAYNRSPKSAPGVKFVTLSELLSRSDIVTVHCPLNRDSEKMCDAGFFRKMKNSAYFINTSRGGVVDERALYEALENNEIAGAAIDVVSVEPMEKGCILKNAKNITITPHAAWAPVETRSRLLDIVEDNLASYLDGTPKHVVNNPAGAGITEAGLKQRRRVR